jgi:cupin superfamily protein
MDIRDPEQLESVTLTPGDMLYLPAGTWHKTCAVGGQSLGLTLRCLEGSAFDLLQSILDKHLTDHQWHEMLPPIGRSITDQLAIPPDIESLLAARLNDLRDFVASLTVIDLAHIWAARFVYPRTGVTMRSEVTIDDQLRVSKNAIVLRSNDTDPEGTYWIHNGRTECKLSLADPTWFESVMQAGSFTASESCCWGSEMLPWDTAKSWLEELISVELVSFASE